MALRKDQNTIGEVIVGGYHVGGFSAKWVAQREPVSNHGFKSRSSSAFVDHATRVVGGETPFGGREIEGKSCASFRPRRQKVSRRRQPAYACSRQGPFLHRRAGLLNRPRRPLSRGFNPASRPAKPLVSYQSNRQLSGWNLPPPAIRALGARCKNQDSWNKPRPLVKLGFFVPKFCSILAA